MFDPPAVVEAVAALGLRSTGGLTAEYEGLVDGLRVRLRGAWNRQSDLDLIVEAFPAFGLDLGLWVRQAGLFLGGPANVETGHAAFDGVMQVSVAEGEEAAGRSLVDESIRAALQGLLVVGRPEVTDTLVALNLSSLHLASDALLARVRDCVRIARAVDALGARLPPPTALAPGVAAAFEAACAEHGLGYRAHPMTGTGETRDAAVSVAWRARATAWSAGTPVLHDGDRTGFRLALRFHEPLGAGLRVEPAGLGDRLKGLIGLGDVEFGDAGFDRAWRVEAKDARAAEELLTEAARSRLGGLRALGLTLTLHDGGLDGSGALPTDPAGVPEAIRLAVGLREAMRPSTARGAYR